MPRLKGPVPQVQAKEGPMPQLVKKRRSGWAVLGLVALVASLLAAVASPVGAAERNGRLRGRVVGVRRRRRADQPYTDVSEDHAFRDAINCIAYYGITKGTGDGSTFSPDADVSRQAMALFIARTAEVAGVDLGDAMDAGFSDIGDAWADAQDAINQLASKEMIPSGDTFRPNDAITRAEMATFLIGLLNKASPNVTIDDDGVIELGEGRRPRRPTTTSPTPCRPCPVANDQAAAALFELGVTEGTGRGRRRSRGRPWTPTSIPMAR